MILKNIYYTDERDISLIEKGLNYNIWLVCGEDHEKQAEMRKLFVKKCSSINIVPKNLSHPILNGGTLGYCCSDEEQNYTIEMFGYENSDNIKETIHESVHEFCHAMQHVASYILRDRSLDYIYNGSEYSVHGGEILEHKLNVTENKYDRYGRFFCETITDLLTYVELCYLDENFKNKMITADNILKDKYQIMSSSNFYKSGYNIYLSIARLAIAAFSNVGNISYDEIIKSGDSIILGEVKNKDDSKKTVNDLLYGIMCDARYVEEEYDKYMGNNSYYNLCKTLDAMLGNKVNSSDVKKVMTDLAKFHNKKVQHLLSSGIISDEAAIGMTNDFNLVFNNMQREYNSTFTREDIPSIRNEFVKKIDCNI